MIHTAAAALTSCDVDRLEDRAPRSRFRRGASKRPADRRGIGLGVVGQQHERGTLIATGSSPPLRWPMMRATLETNQG